MKLGTQKDYPLIPVGEHVLKLTSCDISSLDDKFGSPHAVDGKVDRLKWRFVSNETDDDGVPYDYVVYTGLDGYGNPKAGLTVLVDMLVPGMTVETFADFDTDDLLGKRFKATIKHVKKTDGQWKPQHVYMTPVKPKAETGKKTAGAKPDGEDLSDPFADE